MPDVFSKGTRSDIMRKVKGKDTKLELKVRSALWLMGYRFKANNPSLPGTPDLVFSGAKTVVFVDSCFWHGCSQHIRMPKSNKDYWKRKIERNVERDKEVSQKYDELGWRVIRVWEHSVKESLDSTIEDLDETLKKEYERSR